MSTQERQELEALKVWLETFPQIAKAKAKAEKGTKKTKQNGRGVNILDDPDVCRVILDVASEICHSADGSGGEEESLMGQSGDVWDAILALSSTGSSGGSRKKSIRSLDPPVQDTPHVWTEYGKHAAMATLLDGAVAHKDLACRKQYIERIMGLSAETQRSLMSLIERRKKTKTKTNDTSVGGRRGGKTPNSKVKSTPSTPATAPRSSSSISRSHTKQSPHVNTTTTNTPLISLSHHHHHPSPKTKTKTGASSSRPTPESPRITPKSPRIKRSSPGDERMGAQQQQPKSPFSSPFQSSMTTAGVGGARAAPESSPLLSSSAKQARNLFVSPSAARSGNVEIRDFNNNNMDDRTPRRSFEQAFGGSATSDGRRGDNHNNFTDGSTPKRPSPNNRAGRADISFFSPGLGDTMEIEKQFQALKEQNEELATQLAKKEAREDELVQAMEQSEASFRNEMMKVESEARRRQDETRSEYQEQMQQLREELSKLQQQYTEAERAQSELAGVKDEMELLAHTKNQLAETQERLQTYREKVQQLSDVREALKREEEAHSKSVEECLRLENELKNTQPLKRQLEDYKTRAVEAEVRLTEMQDELKKIQEKRWVSMDATNDTDRTLQSQQEEIFELRMRLQQETSKGREDGEGGVGDGLSELNPELKEEVFRLRNENQRLRDFAAKREDDAVDKLERDLEDAARLGDRFKAQYLSTKDQLEHTQRNLQASRDRESKLRTEVAQAMDKIKSTQEMVEDVSQQLYQCNENLTESRNRESELEGELATWVEQAKELQEHANTLTAELRGRTNELEASKNRESKLNQQVAEWKEGHAALQSSLMETTEQLEKTHTALESSEARESNLRSQLDQWTSTSNTLEEQVQTLNGKLDKVNMQLQESRGSEERLAEQVDEATQFLTEANDKCEELVSTLTATQQELSSTQQSLAQSQEQEEELKAELLDMTSRAEDAETVSKKRMDLVQSTRDKLQAAQEEIEQLKELESNLLQQVVSWTQQAETSQAHAVEVQNQLDDTTRQLHDSKETNERNQEEMAQLAENILQLTEKLSNWKSKAKAEEERTIELTEEVARLRDELSDTQLTLQSSKSNEETMGEGITHAEHMIFSLEETIEVEANIRQEVERQLEMALSELAKVKEEFEATKARMNAQVEEQAELSTKFKQDLFHSQETLNSIQSSLGASQHREKMLKLEITKLQDQATELERELDLAKLDVERTTIETTQSMEQTCGVINAKAQKEIEEIQSNMNRLLEDERRAKRQADEAYQLQIKELRQTFDEEMAKVQSTTKENLEQASRGNEDKIKSLREDYEAQMELIKKTMEEQNSQLMARGKDMLKDVKTKAKREQDTLREELQEMQQKFSKEQEDKERIIVQAKTKVAGYKKKLEFASSRVNTLSADTDEMESKIKSLEREKFKLAEENDRYRRQLGGRGGPDSKLQGQLDLLQKEFKSAMEEARELRRKLKERDEQSIGGFGSLDTIDENANPIYSRDAVNQSTLVQLRTEYEETIEALNDEKRELVMKNSAAATDVQKAEKRAWESEQENSTLKQQITSLQLQLERVEQMIHSSVDEPPPPPPGVPSSKSSVSKGSRRSKRLQKSSEDDDTAELKTAVTDVSSLTGGNSIEISRVDSPPTAINALCQAVYEAGTETAVLAVKNSYSNRDEGRALLPSNGVSPGDITKARNALPSFVELHGATTAGGDQEAPPECKQC